MKSNLSFERIADTDYEMTTDYGAVRVETILFHKHTKEKDICHKARKITYQDKTKKRKIRFISLLTNDFQMSAEDIIAIYKKRWQIETLFKQIKQNFPLRYFYGEKCECYKNTNMDYAYSQSAYNPSEEQNKETLEFLRLGNNDKNSTYELCLNTKIL